MRSRYIVKRACASSYSGRPGSLSLTALPTSWPSTRSSFLSITLNLGGSSRTLALPHRAVQLDPRWHEQDPDQIIQACEDCIDEAVKSMEAAGYPRGSIKVIGTSRMYRVV